MSEPKVYHSQPLEVRMWMKLTLAAVFVVMAVVVGISFRYQRSQSFDACESARAIMDRPALANGTLLLTAGERIIVNRCIA